MREGLPTLFLNAPRYIKFDACELLGALYLNEYALNFKSIKEYYGNDFLQQIWLKLDDKF